MRLILRTHYRFTRPPTRLRRARLDNIALVPATLLFHKAKYKALANRLPTGSVLICTSPLPRQKKTLEKVADFLRTTGHQVTTIPAEHIAAS